MPAIAPQPTAPHNLIQMQPSPPQSPRPFQEAKVRKPRMYHNAVYYQYDGRPPSEVLQPEILSLIYYMSVGFDVHGQIFLGNPELDSNATIDGVPGGVLRACTDMKKRNNHLKIVLSIDAKREDAFRSLLYIAANEDLRRTFSHSAFLLVDRHNLDGIDLHWGVPETPQQGADMLKLLHELRQALPSPTYWISVALPADKEWALKHLNIRSLGVCVDLINVMCFNLVSKEARVTGHASAVYQAALQCADYAQTPDCHACLQRLQEQGVPMHKVMLGISSLGQVFHGATGPGQRYEKISFIPYSQLPLPGAKISEDTKTGFAYCVDQEGARFVSYDNRLTVEVKAAFVRSNNLAGIVVKQACFDVRKDGLVEAAYRALHPKDINL